MGNNSSNSIDKLVSRLLPLAKEQQRLAGVAVDQYSPQVDVLIEKGVKDSRRIEWLLDRMLDFCYSEDMLRLYKKLCRYYFTMDPEATAFYVYAYRDMWEEKPE